MRTKFSCSITTERDRKVAELFKNGNHPSYFTLDYIVSLRDLYSDYHKLGDNEDLDILLKENPDILSKDYLSKYQKALISYDSMVYSDVLKGRNQGTNRVEQLKAAKKEISSPLLVNRAEYIAREFINILNELQTSSKFKIFTKEQILNEIDGGQHAIFNDILHSIITDNVNIKKDIAYLKNDLKINYSNYNHLLTSSSLEFWKSGNIIRNIFYTNRTSNNPQTVTADIVEKAISALEHIQSENIKIINNWSSVITLSRKLIKDMASISLDNKTLDAEDASFENLDEELKEIFNPEECNKEGRYNDSAELHSMFQTATPRIKYFLSKLPKVKTFESFDTKATYEDFVYDDMYHIQYYSPTFVTELLSKALNNCKDSTDLLNYLLNDSTIDFDLRTRIAEMLQDDPTLGTAIFNCLKKTTQLYSVLSESGEGYNTPIINDTLNDTFKPIAGGYRKAGIFDNLNEKHRACTTGRKLQELKRNFEEYSKLGSKVTSDTYSKLYTILYQLGYFNEESDSNNAIQILESILSNKNTRETINKLLKKLIDTIDIPKNENQIVTFNEVLNRKIGSNKIDLTRKYYGRLFKKLDTLISPYMYENRAKHVDKSGKLTTYYSKIYPGYMSSMFDSINYYIANNDKNGLKDFIENNFLKSSMFALRDKNGNITCIYNSLLESLYNAVNDTTNNTSLYEQLGDVFRYNRLLGDGIQDAKNFSSKRHLISLLHSFTSNYRTDKNDIRTAQYPTFILGDSNILKYYTAPKYTVLDENRDVDITPVIDRYYNLFLGEQKRKSLFKAFNEYCKNFGIKSIKEISSNNSVNEYSNPLLESVRKQIVADGHKTTEVLNENYVKKIIKDKLEEGFKEFTKYIEEFGITSNEGMDYFKSCISETQSNTDYGGGKYKDLNTLLKDFYYSYKLQMSNFIDMMTIDKAFYSSVEEMQKRLKAIHSNGTPLDILVGKNTRSDTQKVLYFSDIKNSGNDEFNDFLNNYLHSNKELTTKEKDSVKKAYKESSSTDGQGYRSFTSYRDVCRMTDKWSDANERYYQTWLMFVENNEKKGKTGIDKYKLTDIQKKMLAGIENVSFVPLKPILFSHEEVALNDENVFEVPVQHKYAEIPIIPGILAEGTLNDLAALMEIKGVDLALSTKAVKTGCFGEVNINVNSREELEGVFKSDNFSKSIHTLKYEDLKLQTNLSDHIYGDRQRGTQITKLILENILSITEEELKGFLPEIKLDDNTILSGETGGGLNKIYQSVIAAKMIKSLIKFKKLIGNKEKLSDRLIKGSISNSLKGMDNIFAYALTKIEDGKGNVVDDFLVPLFESSIKNDSEASILSIFKQDVNKQYTLGGSGVQASSFGIKGYESTGSLHLLYHKEVINGEETPVNYYGVQAEMPFDFKYSDEDGNTYELSYDDYCEDNGEFKKDADGKFLIDKDYPGIRNMIVYRTPTEGYNSIFNVEVVRCSRKTEGGGIIKLPDQLTTIAGFDFDADKLYFIRKNFIKFLEGYSKSQLLNIFGVTSEDGVPVNEESIYGKYPTIYAALKIIKANSTVAHDTLNKYWPNNEQELKLIVASLPESQRDLVNKAFRKDGDKNGEFITKASKIREVSKKFGYIESRFAEYNPNKTPIENSQYCLDNLILEIMQKVIESKATLAKRTIPGTTNIIKRSSLLIKALKQTKSLLDASNIESAAQSVVNTAIENRDNLDIEYDYTEPMTLVKYNQDNQVADKLIGMAANHNTFKIVLKLMEECTLGPNEAGICFVGHQYKSFIPDKSNSKESTYDRSETIAQVLRACVDAIKDHIVNHLNINVYTMPMAMTLAHIGYSTDEISLLLSQPILEEVSNECADNMGTALSTALNNAESKLTQLLRNKGIDVVEKYDNSYDEILSVDVLMKNIASNADNSEAFMDDVENLKSQLRVVLLAKYINEYATSFITPMCNSSKFTSTNTVSGRYSDIYAKILTVKDFIKRMESFGDKIIMKFGNNNITTPISDNDTFKDLLEEGNYEKYLSTILSTTPMGFEQVMYDCIKEMVKSSKDYFPYETDTYTKARDFALSIGRYKPGGVTIEKLHTGLLTYLLSHINGTNFDAEGIIREFTTPDGKIIENITNKEFYLKYFPIIFNDYIRRYNIFNDFTDNIYTEDIKNESDGKTYQVLKSISKVFNSQGASKTKLTTAWSYLMNPTIDIEEEKKLTEEFNALPDKNTKQAYKLQNDILAIRQKIAVEKHLALELKLYAFHAFGDLNTINNFGSFASTDILEEITKENQLTSEFSYVRILKDILNGVFDNIFSSEEKILNFITYYISNNTDDGIFTLKVKKDGNTENLYKFLDAKTKGTETKKNTFTINVSEIDGDNVPVENYGLKYKLIINNSSSSSSEPYKFVPAILIDDALYVLDRSVMPNDVKKVEKNVVQKELSEVYNTPYNEVVTYRLVNILGKKNEFMDYSSPLTGSRIFTIEARNPEEGEIPEAPIYTQSMDFNSDDSNNSEGENPQSSVTEEMLNSSYNSLIENLFKLYQDLKGKLKFAEKDSSGDNTSISEDRMKEIISEKENIIKANLPYNSNFYNWLVTKIESADESVVCLDNDGKLTYICG